MAVIAVSTAGTSATVTVLLATESSSAGCTTFSSGRGGRDIEGGGGRICDRDAGGKSECIRTNKVAESGIFGSGGFDTRVDGLGVLNNVVKRATIFGQTKVSSNVIGTVVEIQPVDAVDKNTVTHTAAETSFVQSGGVNITC